MKFPTATRVLAQHDQHAKQIRALAETNPALAARIANIAAARGDTAMSAALRKRLETTPATSPKSAKKEEKNMAKPRADKAKDAALEIVVAALNLDDDTPPEAQRKAIDGLRGMLDDAAESLDAEEDDSEEEPPTRREKGNERIHQTPGVTGKVDPVARHIAQQMGLSGPELPSVNAARGLSPMTPEQAHAWLAKRGGR